jgi:hypothetical protein
MESKYKIGDKVRVKSLDWYMLNKDEYDNVVLCGGETKPSFTRSMSIYCGKVMTIFDVDSEYGEYTYTMQEDNGRFCWDDEMFEGIVDDKSDIVDVDSEFDSPMENDCRIDDFQDDNEMYDIVDDYIHRLKGNECQIALPEGYQFVDREGNVIDTSIIMVTKKGVEYPKDYDECCYILDDNDRMSLGLMNEFRKLINARNAYWKIYGEANGLGGSWAPDWRSGCYVIYTNGDGLIRRDIQFDINAVLAFPTEDLRDMFYERFKSEIELCKEFI